MKILIDNKSRHIITKALKDGILDLNTIPELCAMVPEKIHSFNSGIGGVFEPNSWCATSPIDRQTKVALLTALSTRVFIIPDSLLKHIDNLKGVEPFLELMKSADRDEQHQD